MKTKLKILSLVLASLSIVVVVAGCGDQSSKLGPPDEVAAAVDMSVDRNQSAGSPKVDILFVIDNSLSMTKHQVNLARNIDGFVDAFSKNASIDFHIGFVPIYDSIKFGTVVKDFYPLGHLLPLRDPKNPQGPRLPGAHYVTADTPDYLDVLKATLKEGETDGPEFEELLSPVVAALSAPVVNGVNAGFYRPDASLVVIFLTDADDTSPNISASGFLDFLYNLKDGDMQKVLPIGVIVPSDASCERDPSGPPRKLNEILAYGKILSLCSTNFGPTLAAYGTEFSTRLARQVVPLTAVPDANSLTVTYGANLVPKDPVKGWSYDSDHNDVIFSGTMELPYQAGAKLMIHFNEVNTLNVDNDRTLRMDVNEPADATTPPSTTSSATAGGSD